MALPPPAPGLVIRFHYLWAREARRGRDEGRYARPCAIVVAETSDATGKITVVVAPVTHSQPDVGIDAVELPAAVKRYLGLDDQRSWVIVEELNSFIWPGHDLDLNARGEVAYGTLPPNLFQKIRAGVLAAAKAGRLSRIVR